MALPLRHKSKLIRSEDLETLQHELRQLLIELASLPKDFDCTADFYSDLGLSSLKAMELLIALEERYGVNVPDEQFIEATSLEPLARMMQGLTG